MLKLEWTVSEVVVTLVDGILVEGESASLFLDSDGRPQIIQVKGKTTSTIPWIQVRHISHA